MIDLAERFGVFREAAKRLASAIKDDKARVIAEEARYARAVLAQIVAEAERRTEKALNP